MQDIARVIKSVPPIIGVPFKDLTLSSCNIHNGTDHCNILLYRRLHSYNWNDGWRLLKISEAEVLTIASLSD